MFKFLENRKYLACIFAMAILAIGSMIVVGARADNDNISVNDGGVVNVYNQENQEGEMALGGSTSGDWNVGQTLDVAGETTLTGGLIYGSATSTITATTTSGDLLLTAAQVCDNGYIDLTADIGTGAFTLTFPTAALLYADCLNANDDTKDSLWVYNLSGDNMTLTAGTGGVLVEENGEDVVIGTGHWAECEVKMMDDGASYLLACTEWQDAD